MLKKEYSYTFTPPVGLNGLFYRELYHLTHWIEDCVAPTAGLDSMEEKISTSQEKELRLYYHLVHGRTIISLLTE